ncbi:MAG TPA: hypothetical protein VGM78_04915 [Ilumatobacteraceae bacterium]|jgi:hypothetical protein
MTEVRPKAMLNTGKRRIPTSPVDTFASIRFSFSALVAEDYRTRDPHPSPFANAVDYDVVMAGLAELGWSSDRIAAYFQATVGEVGEALERAVHKRSRFLRDL